MPKKFNSDFYAKLSQTITQLESHSQAEVVVVIRSRAADYHDIPWCWGMLGAWLAHTYQVFAPPFFDDLVIYLGPILAFIACYALACIPALQGLCLSKKRKQKNVEIMARALFQKGGLHHTQDKTALLVYVSCLEKSTFVLADRAIELAIPNEDWLSFRTQLQAIFNANQPSQALLQALKDIQPDLVQYLPASVNNLNELPNNLEITL
jgi:putative membrane protein